MDRAGLRANRELRQHTPVDQVEDGKGTVHDLRRRMQSESVLFDVPILEYRPYRSFSSNQSSSLLFQLFAAADVPYSEKTAAPAGAPTPELNTVYSVGLRLVFDWRYYP